MIGAQIDAAPRRHTKARKVNKFRLLYLIIGILVALSMIVSVLPIGQ